MAKTEPAKWHTLGAYVACYTLYILLIIPGIVAVFIRVWPITRQAKTHVRRSVEGWGRGGGEVTEVAPHPNK